MAQDIKDNKDMEERAKGPFARFFISGWNNIVRLMGVNVLFLLFLPGSPILLPLANSYSSFKTDSNAKNSLTHTSH